MHSVTGTVPQAVEAHFRSTLVKLQKLDGKMYHHAKLPNLQAVVNIYFVVDGKQVSPSTRSLSL